MRQILVASAALALSLAPVASHAGLFGGGAKPAPKAAADRDAGVAAQVRQALDEKRLVDAGDLLEKAHFDGITSPRLARLEGELLLARGRFADAVERFHQAESDPVERPKAQEGEGLCLSLMGKTDEAFADLKAATVADKTQWRAWNGLGREYDLRHDWKQAKAAYAEALAAPGVNTAIVYNNRGYSYLLQNDPDDAIPDFVSALANDPVLAAARTNLRIAMAMQGHYDRAAVTGSGEDRAAVLNNVGLAAAIRGDYREAEKLLGQAIEAKGANYERAADNLQLAKNLEARRADQIALPTPELTPAPNAPH